jgi:hypothetical protein
LAVRLRPGIVAVFLLVMLPLSVAMIAVLYRVDCNSPSALPRTR